MYVSDSINFYGRLSFNFQLIINNVNTEYTRL